MFPWLVASVRGDYRDALKIVKNMGFSLWGMVESRCVNLGYATCTISSKD